MMLWGFTLQLTMLLTIAAANTDSLWSLDLYENLGYYPLRIIRRSTPNGACWEISKDDFQIGETKVQLESLILTPHSMENCWLFLFEDKTKCEEGEYDKNKIFRGPHEQVWWEDVHDGVHEALDPTWRTWPLEIEDDERYMDVVCKEPDTKTENELTGPEMLVEAAMDVIPVNA
jgi:hypothetical protein